MNESLRVGGIYRFDYLQGNNSCSSRLIRVLRVRDTDKNPIQQKTCKKNPIYRSRYLYTVRQSNGQIRQLYSHSIFCPNKVGLFGRLILWLIGVKI